MSINSHKYNQFTKWQKTPTNPLYFKDLSCLLYIFHCNIVVGLQHQVCLFLCGLDTDCHEQTNIIVQQLEKKQMNTDVTEDVGDLKITLFLWQNLKV